MNKEFKDIIKEYIVKDSNKPYIYSQFITLLYQIITWKSYTKLVKERKILKTDKVIDFLYKKELEKIPETENKIIELIKKWLSYKEIKNILIPNWNKNHEQ